MTSSLLPPLLSIIIIPVIFTPLTVLQILLPRKGQEGGGSGRGRNNQPSLQVIGTLTSNTHIQFGWVTSCVIPWIILCKKSKIKWKEGKDCIRFYPLKPSDSLGQTDIRRVLPVLYPDNKIKMAFTIFFIFRFTIIHTIQHSGGLLVLFGSSISTQIRKYIVFQKTAVPMTRL